MLVVNFDQNIVVVNGLQPITIKQPIVLFLLFVKHVTPQPRYYVCSNWFLALVAPFKSLCS